MDTNLTMSVPDPRLAHLAATVQEGRLNAAEIARKLRKTTGLSQKNLAVRLGIAQRTYIDFERGVGNPTLETLEKIARAYGWGVVLLPRAEPAPAEEPPAPPVDEVAELAKLLELEADSVASWF